MSPTERVDGFSPELRASLFHFTVFASTGASSAYLAIWMSGRGLSPGDIGIVNALPVLLMFGANMLIGRLADRASDWRVAIVILALVSGVASIGFFFATAFWGILAVFTLTALPAGALVPVIDAATLRMTQRRGTDFGFIRAWGTVGYTVTAALTGLLIGWLGPVAFVPIFVFLSLLRAGLALPLPRFRAPETVARVRVDGAKVMGLVRQPWFLLPCIAFALLQSTHLVISAFGALVWGIDGVWDGWFGPLIAIGSAGEAIMMFFWRRIGPMMSARTMLIIAGAFGTVRWTAMAFSPALPVLFVLQVLHAVTLPFGYFGIMHFIANWAPEEIAAEAQGFSSALTQGFAVVTLLIFGWLVGIMGAQAYLVAGGMALGCVLAAWGSLMLRPAHAPPAAA